MGSALQAQTGALTAGTAAGVPGAQVSVAITASNSTGMDGFSFGLAHDAAVVTVNAINFGAALDSDQGGIDPAVLLTNLNPAGGSGLTVGMLLDLSPPLAQLPPGTDQPVLSIDYTISATAAAGASSTITFVETLGAPAVETLLVLDGAQVGPTLTSGLVSVIQNPFLRGDCNQDGATNLVDVVSCLRKLFNIDPATTCARADDINDNGILEVADASYLLQFLFNAGTAIPAPVGTCGIDSTTDTLSCDSHVACP